MVREPHHERFFLSPFALSVSKGLKKADANHLLQSTSYGFIFHPSQVGDLLRSTVASLRPQNRIISATVRTK